jgi:zinc protease
MSHPRPFGRRGRAGRVLARAPRARHARTAAAAARALRSLWLLWLLAPLALASSCAWVAHKPPAAPGTAAAAVLHATLANGLRVTIVRNPLAPVVTTMVNYEVGSNEAPPGFPGTAHAQEHMMFRGSPGLSADQLANVTAAMGGQFDADTQQTVTQYFFTVPAEDLDVALHIEAIRMRGVLDSPSLWAEERGAIEQEVAQDLSNPEYVFYAKLLRIMFKNTPYAHDALGTRPSFQRTSAAALKRFYDTWYVPNNAILLIVGDVQPRAALATVQRLFGDIPAKPLPPRPAVRLQAVHTRTLHLPTDEPYGLAVLAFRLPGFASADYAAGQVLANVLSSQRGDLYALVADGKALYAGFSTDTMPRAGLGYAVGAFPKGADAEKLLRTMRAILTRNLAHGLPADLVDAAKRHLVADAEFQKNSVSGLAMAWSQALAVEHRRSPQDDVRAIERVSVADVDRVARRYLNLRDAVVAVLTPHPSGKPVSPKGFGGRESFAPPRTAPVPLPDWAAEALARLSIPTSTVHPVVTKLPNGVRLIVQPESISNTVGVYGHVKNNPDLEAPAGQEGVDEMLDRLFSFGTTSLDRLAFQKALDDIAAQESAGTDFSLRVVANHFARGVQLLADNELHPALPAKACAVIRPELAASVAGRLQSPGYLVDRALHAALFPAHDPTLRQATPATVSALQPDDVRRYYTHVVRPDLTTIVVIGNVTAERAKAVIEKYFGGWSASGPAPNTVLPPVPLNPPSVTAVPDATRVQDKVTLAETLGLTRSNPDYYALQLGNHVLGGAFYATRLYRDLRERTGLVYFVSSSFDVDKTRGLYAASYACDPPNVAKARAIVARDLQDMQNAPVSPAELRQAQALLLREIPLSESSIASIAGGLLSRAAHDLPLDEPTRAAHRYVALDAAQVRAAFAKWVRPGALVEVVQGPAPR